MAGTNIGHYQTNLAIGAAQGSAIVTAAALATASAEDGYAVANLAVGAVSATASASYGFLPEFDEFVTTGTWLSTVTFAEGDQFIVELSGANAATNPRCRVSVRIEETL